MFKNLGGLCAHFTCIGFRNILSNGSFKNIYFKGVKLKPENNSFPSSFSDSMLETMCEIQIKNV